MSRKPLTPAQATLIASLDRSIALGKELQAMAEAAEALCEEILRRGHRRGELRQADALLDLVEQYHEAHTWSRRKRRRA